MSNILSPLLCGSFIWFLETFLFSDNVRSNSHKGFTGNNKQWLNTSEIHETMTSWNLPTVTDKTNYERATIQVEQWIYKE